MWTFEHILQTGSFSRMFYFLLNLIIWKNIFYSEISREEKTIINVVKGHNLTGNPSKTVLSSVHPNWSVWPARRFGVIQTGQEKWNFPKKFFSKRNYQRSNGYLKRSMRYTYSYNFGYFAFELRFRISKCGCMFITFTVWQHGIFFFFLVSVVFFVLCSWVKNKT